MCSQVTNQKILLWSYLVAVLNGVYGGFWDLLGCVDVVSGGFADFLG